MNQNQHAHSVPMTQMILNNIFHWLQSFESMLNRMKRKFFCKCQSSHVSSTVLPVTTLRTLQKLHIIERFLQNFERNAESLQSTFTACISCWNRLSCSLSEAGTKLPSDPLNQIHRSHYSSDVVGVTNTTKKTEIQHPTMDLHRLQPFLPLFCLAFWLTYCR